MPFRWASPRRRRPPSWRKPSSATRRNGRAIPRPRARPSSAPRWPIGLTRRYRLPAGLIDRDAEIMPCAGSREAIFHVALATRAGMAGQGRAAGGADPQPLLSLLCRRGGDGGGRAGIPAGDPARRASCPIPTPCPRRFSRRTALAYVCSPSNPQGAVAEQGLSRPLARAWPAAWVHRRLRRMLRRDLFRPAAGGRAGGRPTGVSTTWSCCIPSPSAPRRPACARASSPATVG